MLHSLHPFDPSPGSTFNNNPNDLNDQINALKAKSLTPNMGLKIMAPS